MVDLGKLKIDLSMDKTINDYPLSSLPSKQNKRTGKAKLSLFEQIDPNLYDEHAKIITFYTNLDRIQPWIKTLDIYYYDNLGKEPDYDIEWYDEPKIWENRNNSGNSVMIEVLKKGELQFNITFFVTTGTIRVQGSHYYEFVDIHFPILKDILDKVLTNISQTSPTTNTCISHECHDDNNNTHINELCPVDKVTCVLPDSQTGLKSVLVQEDQPQKDDFQRLELNLVDTLAKIEHSHNENFSKVLTAVKQCNDDVLVLGKGRKDDNEISTLQLKYKTVQTEKQTLEVKLKHEQSNIMLIKAQHEDQMKCHNQILEETRAEMKKVLTTSNSEIDFLSVSLQTKNEEIDKLTDTLKRHTQHLEKLQEENISLRSQMISRFEDFHLVNADTKYIDKSKLDIDNKPTIILIGTSNTKRINAEKLSPSFTTNKVTAFNLEETKQAILEISDIIPNLVVFHSLTNDLKIKSPQQCVEEIQDIVKLALQKWQNSGCIISLTTPRLDSVIFNTNGQIINALLKQIYDDNKDVLLVDHGNMLRNGNPIAELLSQDKFHLSDSGVSQLSANLKRGIHTALNIPMPNSRGRSKSRNTRGRGRGRGRGHHE
ncbi:Hypothetical predicted protein [Mytilus galloprovincialis]|uniref:Uncharacterized protein n=1 Tax=Mytilus galloprovincialis TaxID=29158 RepID=A0A8B6H451_MYTGA|nr:Hypothetical predicted protein [Mytilus galloprovincialis]